MTVLAQISETQSGKATTANDIFEAVAPAGFGGRKASLSVGLTWAYYGGYFLVEGSPSYITLVPDGTITLQEGANYIEANTGGVIQLNAGSPVGFTPGKLPLYQVTVASGLVTSYTDRRMLKLQAHP